MTENRTHYYGDGCPEHTLVDRRALPSGSVHVVLGESRAAMCGVRATWGNDVPTDATRCPRCASMRKDAGIEVQDGVTDWLGDPANTAEHYPMLPDLALCRGDDECRQMCRPDRPCDCCIVAAGGTPEPQVDWEGVAGATEHRTTGGRAWCFACATYCYPHIEEHCGCCLTAAEFTQVWLPAESHPEHEALAAWLAERVAASQDPVREVIEALRVYAYEGRA